MNTSVFKKDLAKIIDEHNLQYKVVSGTDERVFLCPSCGKDDHFYFNIKKGLGICHRCNFECNAIIFIMAMLSLPYDDAVGVLRARESISFDGLRGRLMQLRDDLDYVDEDLNTYEVFFKNPLPENLIDVSKKTFPKIFNERGVSLELALSTHAKICNVSGEYYNRIIFPIKTLKSETFTAVTSYSKAKVKRVQQAAKERGGKYRKSLFPKRSFMSEIVYNYNRIRYNKKFVIVEGIWDHLALKKLKIPSCGLLGSTVSKKQAELLSRTEAEVIYLMLDGSLPEKVLKKNHKLLSEMCYDKEVRVCVLEGEKDPDESTELAIKKAILDSRLLYYRNQKK